MESIYLIRAGKTSKFKIGKAKDPQGRLRRLQIGCPFPLELFATSSSTNAIHKEKKYHKRFEKKRIHGEWFELTPFDVGLILSEWKYDPGIHYSRRVIEKLSVGDNVFVSFDSREVLSGKVVELHADTISVSLSDGTNTLYYDEVRKDPFESLKNRVTM